MSLDWSNQPSFQNPKCGRTESSQPPIDSRGRIPHLAVIDTLFHARHQRPECSNVQALLPAPTVLGPGRWRRPRSRGCRGGCGESRGRTRRRRHGHRDPDRRRSVGLALLVLYLFLVGRRWGVVRAVGGRVLGSVRRGVAVGRRGLGSVGRRVLGPVGRRALGPVAVRWARAFGGQDGVVGPGG